MFIEKRGLNNIINVFKKNSVLFKFVGGCVRDRLLEHQINDIDIATPEKPETIKNIFEGENYKLLLYGIDHGTVGVLSDGNKFEMELPFIVLATQNPVEQEGTYRLPEAQLDRFLFKINVEYPALEEEIEIITREHQLEDKEKIAQITPVITGKDVINLQRLVTKIRVEPNILKYIAEIVVNTRNNAFLYLGASPRASIAILKAAKGFAALNARDFVTPEDVKNATLPVLQHRVIVTPEREMEGISSKQIIAQIIETIEIPR